MSPVFERMFQNEWDEVKENKIKIKDFKPKIVKLAVEFFYDRMSPHISFFEAINLLRFADKYDIQSMHVSSL